jgi:hypothetical protein
MRYCEVFRTELDRRAREKWTTPAARAGLLTICGLLAEAAGVARRPVRHPR